MLASSGNVYKAAAAAAYAAVGGGSPKSCSQPANGTAALGVLAISRGYRASELGIPLEDVLALAHPCSVGESVHMLGWRARWPSQSVSRSSAVW